MSQLTSTVRKIESREIALDSVPVGRMQRLIDDWLADCRIRQHSPRTIELRRMLCGRLMWFLEAEETADCGRMEMRQFFAYLSGGHEGSTGRWDKPQKRYSKPLRPITVQTYFFHVQAFFNWLVGEEYVAASPMEKIGAPVVRSDQ